MDSSSKGNLHAQPTLPRAPWPLIPVFMTIWATTLASFNAVVSPWGTLLFITMLLIFPLLLLLPPTWASLQPRSLAIVASCCCSSALFLPNNHLFCNTPKKAKDLFSNLGIFREFRSVLMETNRRREMNEFYLSPSTVSIFFIGELSTSSNLRYGYRSCAATSAPAPTSTCSTPAWPVLLFQTLSPTCLDDRELPLTSLTQGLEGGGV